MDVNKQNECKWFQVNQKGFCMFGEKEGHGIACLKKKLYCPYAWNWIERSYEKKWNIN